MNTGLPQTQVAAFHRDGHLFPLDVYDADETAPWAEEVLALAAAGLDDHPAPWHQKTHLLLPSLDAVVTDPRLTDLVAKVLGPDLLALSADVFVKPPYSERRITWHQDINYLALEPFELLTAWVALTDATPANGGMRYASGRHASRLDHTEHPDALNILTRGQELAVAVDDHEAVDVALRAGQVSFHHALTPHASGPNTTAMPRIGFAVRYASTSVRQLAGPPITARLARGTDHFGHFELETPPTQALSTGARAEHARALAPHAATGYSTV